MARTNNPERQKLFNRPLKAMVFDLDEVVWKQKRRWLGVVQQVIEEERVKEEQRGEPISMRRLLGLSGGNIVAQAIEYAGLLNADPEILSTEINARHLEETRDGVSLAPGAVKALKTCKRLGLSIAAATSGREHIVIPRLEQMGLHRFISRKNVVTREKVTALKPDPESVIVAAQLLGVDPEEAAMVGDEPTDIISGRDAGARTVLVANGVYAGKRSYGADLIVPGLHMLTENALRSIGVING